MRKWPAAAVAMVVIGAWVLVGCGSSGEQDDSAAASPATLESPANAAAMTEFSVVPAPALEGNLLGDPAELRVAIWLPPSYSSTDHSYPVVYFLAGFEEDASVAPIGAALEDALTTGTVPEVLVVAVSGRNSLGGSFYVDSPVTGGWATAIHRDLVGWVDERGRRR